MKNNRKDIQIELTDVSLNFKNKIIFDHFSFTINKGEKIIIYGKSGSGKSTLLQLLLAFQKVDSGEIFLFGKKLSEKNILEIRSKIAYVDQDVVMGEGKTREIFQEYFSFRSNKQKTFSKEKLEKIMEDFDLELDLLEKDISQLSGGERQRIAIILALLLDRPLMLLDEVSSSLDAHSKELIIKKLLSLKEKTLLIVTHDKEWQQNKKIKVFDFKDKQWVA